MITGIAIENFKGIRERVEIEIRPITLLFGANSAGKSTILHALQYASEVFERHHLSPDSTTAGGNAVDLGGFRNFVHGQNVDLPIRLTFEVDCREFRNHEMMGELPYVNKFLQTGGLNCFALCSRQSITVEIRWSQMFGRPYVAALYDLVDGTEILNITSDPAGRRVELRINSDHPKLELIADWRPDDYEHPLEKMGVLLGSQNKPENCLSRCVSFLSDICETTDDGGFFLENAQDALLDARIHSAIPFARTADDETPPLEMVRIVNAYLDAVYPDVNDGIGRFLWPALRDIRNFLLTLRHLGPLREIPSRGYAPPSMLDDSRWASGLGAWDLLSSADDKLIGAVSSWLGDEDRLNSGYRLRMKRYKELDLSDPLVLQLLSGSAFDETEEDARLDLEKLPMRTRLLIMSNNENIELRPNDVGIGLSQLVPVIVTALDGENRIISIEQPELHVHPKLQSEIGDLFVYAMTNRKHRFLLETHSEHLILRLLRRIRESADGELPDDKLPLKPDDIAVYYIDSTPGGVKATRLRVDETGEFVDRWPQGFFEERAKELF